MSNPILTYLPPRTAGSINEHLKNDVINEIKEFNWSDSNDDTITPLKFFDDFWYNVRIVELTDLVGRINPLLNGAVLNMINADPVYAQMAQDMINSGHATVSEGTRPGGASSLTDIIDGLRRQEFTRINTVIQNAVSRIHPRDSANKTITTGTGQDFLNLLGWNKPNIIPTEHMSWSLDINGRGGTIPYTMPSGAVFNVQTFDMEFSVRSAQIELDSLTTVTDCVNEMVNDSDFITANIDWEELLSVLEASSGTERSLPISPVKVYSQTQSSPMESTPSRFGVVVAKKLRQSAIVTSDSTGIRWFPFAKFDGNYKLYTFFHEIVGHGRSEWDLNAITSHPEWRKIVKYFFDGNVLNGERLFAGSWPYDMWDLHYGSMWKDYASDKYPEEFLCRVLGMLIINRGASFTHHILPEINRRISAIGNTDTVDEGFAYIVDNQMKTSGLYNRIKPLNLTQQIKNKANILDLENLMARTVIGKPGFNEIDDNIAIQRYKDLNA
jgi:hypothetical protein